MRRKERVLTIGRWSELQHSISGSSSKKGEPNDMPVREQRFHRLRPNRCNAVLPSGASPHRSARTQYLHREHVETRLMKRKKTKAQSDAWALTPKTYLEAVVYSMLMKDLQQQRRTLRIETIGAAVLELISNAHRYFASTQTMACIKGSSCKSFGLRHD